MNTRSLVLAVLLLAAPAAAQGRMEESFGAWRAFTDGASCGMESASGPRLLRITQAMGGEMVTFQVSRGGWRIPPGEAIALVMQVDNQEAILVRSARGAEDAIRFTVDRERFADFSPQFTAGGTLRLSFPDGDEQPWFVSLRGSSAAYASFWRCLGGMGSTPQPFGRGQRQEGEPQPFRPFQLPL